MRMSWWLVATLLVSCNVVHADDLAKAPATGTVPPALLGKDRDGTVVDLAAHRGKVVIVTFCASWCGYCLKELPVLNALQTTIGTDFLTIVAVNVKDENPAYRQMTKQMRDYALLMTRDRDGAIAEGYGVKSYPNLWMIDPQGRVASHHVGYGEDSLDRIIAEIRRLLTEELQRQEPAKQAALPASQAAVGS